MREKLDFSFSNTDQTVPKWLGVWPKSFSKTDSQGTQIRCPHVAWSLRPTEVSAMMLGPRADVVNEALCVWGKVL